MTLGEQLKELRARSGFSQEQVAERVGVSRQAVTKWETGQTIPAAENLAALAELYQVSLDDLGEDRSACVRDGEENPVLRENRTVIALSAQLGFLYALIWGLPVLLDQGRPDLINLLPLVGNAVFLLLCSMWTVWNLSFEPDLVRRRKNQKIELCYMGVQLFLAGLSLWLGLGLAGFGAAVAVLCLYLAVVNPKYMGRRLWRTRPKKRNVRKLS